jgi:hypothetical protein
VKPWTVAQDLFDPPDESGVRSGTLNRLGFWRSALGLATVALISLTFGKSPYASAVDNSLDLAANAVISAAVMLFCLVGIYLVTKRRQRRTLVRGTRRMVRNLVLVVFTVVTPILLIDYVAVPHYRTVPLLLVLTLLVCGPLPCLSLVYLAQRDRLIAQARTRYRIVLTLIVGTTLALAVLTTTGVHSDDRIAKVLVPLAGVVPATWWMIYVPCATYWTARTVMWVGAVHPMLAPIGATLLVAATFEGKLTGYKADEVPFDVWLAMSVTGLVTTFVVAAFEIRHLRRSGVGLRSGSQPGGGKVMTSS